MSWTSKTQTRESSLSMFKDHFKSSRLQDCPWELRRAQNLGICLFWEKKTLGIGLELRNGGSGTLEATYKPQLQGRGGAALSHWARDSFGDLFWLSACCNSLFCVLTGCGLVLGRFICCSPEGSPAAAREVCCLGSLVGAVHTSGGILYPCLGRFGRNSELLENVVCYLSLSLFFFFFFSFPLFFCCCLTAKVCEWLGRPSVLSLRLTRCCRERWLSSSALGREEWEPRMKTGVLGALTGGNEWLAPEQPCYLAFFRIWLTENNLLCDWRGLTGFFPSVYFPFYLSFPLISNGMCAS